MSKYNEVMDHISVDDEMKKRILLNVEKRIQEEGTSEPDPVVPKKSNKIVEFRRYAAIAATFAVLLVGAYAVTQITGSVKNTSSTALMDSSPAAEVTESAAEAPAAAESEMASDATMDSEEEVVVQENAVETQTTGATSDSAKMEASTHVPKIEDSSSTLAQETSAESATPALSPALIIIGTILLIGVIIFIIMLVIK